MGLHRSAILLSLLFFCAALPSFAQSGVHYHDFAFVNQGGFIHPLANASISVCAYGSSGVPCSPTTPVYSDVGLTHLKLQPFLADANGNYDFWAAAGNYLITVTYTGFGINGGVGYSTVASLGGSSSAPVTSVFGRTGAVVSATNDYNFNQLAGSASVPQGGTGVGTLTGVVKGNGTSPFSAAAAADIFGLFSGTHDSSHCTAGDGTMQLCSGGAAGGGTGWINVKDAPYNCVGDGSTNDATCIDAASAAAVALCVSNGGNATSAPIVYFPPSTGNYVYAGTWTAPGTNKCPLTFMFNNSLSLDQLVPAGYDSFIGLGGGNFNGLIGSFNFVPTVNFTQTSVNKPLVDCNPCVTNHFEGINFESSGANTNEVVHIHDLSGSGSTKIDFYHDTVNNNGSGGGILADSSANNIVAGFGLRIWNCSISAQGTTFPLSLTNFGAVKVSDSFLGGTGYGAIYVKNAGIGEANQFIFDNILDEALNGRDFLYIDSTASGVTEITLRNVDISDSFGSPQPTLINNTGGNTGRVVVEQAGDVSAATYVNTSHPVALDFCIGQRCVATVKATGGYTPQMIGGATALNNGPAPFGIASSANQYIPSISFDPGYGVGLGDSVNFGVTARLQQRAKQSFDISLAQAMAPTGVGAAVQAGAGLANGTYYWIVFSTLNNGNCNTTSTSPSRSAGSFEVTATTTTGNNQVLISWTQATGAGIQGYCVTRGTSSFGEDHQYFVSGVGTTSFTDVGGAALVAGIGYPAFNYSFPTQNYPNDTGNGQYHFGLAGLVATLPLGGTSLQVLNGGFAGSLSGTLTGNRTYTAPDANASLAQPFTAVSHQFLTDMTSAGLFHAAQPAFSDISGTLAAAQCPNPSASTIGCVESLAAITHQFLISISTAGVVAQAQPTLADVAAGAAPSGTFDFSGVTLFKARFSAGATSSTNGDFVYDTTNKNWHFWANGTDEFLGLFASAPTNTDCLDASVSSSVITIGDNGGPCPITLASASHKFFTSYTSTTGLFTAAQPTLADIAAGVAPTGTFDFSGSTALLHPSAASAAPTVGGDMRYDSTQLSNMVGGAGAITGAVPRVLATCFSESSASNCIGTGATTGNNDKIDANGTGCASGSGCFFATTFQIPANYLVKNRALRVTYVMDFDSSSTASTVAYNLRIQKSGPTNVVLFTGGTTTPPNSKTGLGFAISFIIQGTVAAGASANIETGATGGAGLGGTIGTMFNNTLAQPIAGDTTSAQTIQLGVLSGTATAGNTQRVRQMIVEELH